MSRIPARTQPPRRPDVVGLVTGSVMTLFALWTLLMAFGVNLSAAWLKAAVPVLLIVVGGAGLALSRGRDAP